MKNKAVRTATFLSGHFVGMLIGGLLVRSSIAHLENSYGFLATVYSYDLLSRQLGVFVAAVLPTVQLTLGIMMLFFAERRLFCLQCSALMLSGFTVIQFSAYYRDLNIDCGCFGSSAENPIDLMSISFTAGLGILAAVASYFLRSKRQLA